MKFKENGRLDLICFGRAGVDLNPIEFNTPLEEVSGFIKSVGGSPANIAVGTARQGLKVGFIGRVSGDGLGKYVYNYFREEGINTEGLIFDSSYLNGLALTEVRSPDSCNAILYRENAADLYIDCDDVNEAYIKDAKAIMISGTAFAKSPSREAAFLAMEYAKKHDTKIIMDIDYRPYSWRTDKETSLCYTMACEKCDIIIGTREEFDAVEFLWDKENDSDDKTAGWLLEKGAELVLIKRGGDGSAAYEKGKAAVKAPIVKTNLQKTFGAGDAYASGFIASFMGGRGLKECMIRGAATASIVISKRDCTKAMPNNQELNEYLEKNYRSE